MPSWTVLVHAYSYKLNSKWNSYENPHDRIAAKHFWNSPKYSKYSNFQSELFSHNLLSYSSFYLCIVYRSIFQQESLRELLDTYVHSGTISTASTSPCKLVIFYHLPLHGHVSMFTAKIAEE